MAEGASSVREAHPQQGRWAGWFASLRELTAIEMIAVATLIIAAGPFLDAIWRTRDNWLILQFLWTALAVIWLAVLWKASGLRWLRWTLSRMALLGLVLLLAFFSFLWSPEPGTSALRAGAVLATTIVGLALGYLFSPQALMRVLFWAYSVTLIVWALYVLAIMSGFWPGMPARGESTALQPLPMLGVTLGAVALGHILSQRALAQAFTLTACAILAAMVIVLLAPGLAIDACCGGAGWKRTLSHGEQLGVFAGQAALFFLIALALGRLDRPLALAMAGLALATALLTHSASAKIALAGGAAMIVSIVAGKRLRLGPTLVFPLAIIGIAGGVAAALSHWETVAETVGRSPTLTGRTPLWADAIKLIAERPLTGHGFQIIYHEFGRTYFPHIDSTWFQPHPHNTYLHIAAQLGLPALGLMVIFALVTLYRAFVVFSAQWSAFGLFASGYLMLYCVVNVSGSWMLEAFQFEWVVFIALATALARRTEPVPRPVRARARATASRPAAS